MIALTTCDFVVVYYTQQVPLSLCLCTPLSFLSSGGDFGTWYCIGASTEARDPYFVIGVTHGTAACLQTLLTALALLQ